MNIMLYNVFRVVNTPHIVCYSPFSARDIFQCLVKQVCSDLYFDLCMQSIVHGSSVSTLAAIGDCRCSSR